MENLPVSRKVLPPVFAVILFALASAVRAEESVFRALLFADQSLEDLVARVGRKADASDNSAFARYVRAKEFIDAKQPQKAALTLRAILAMPKLETRHKLWTWNALRALGQTPSKKDATAIQGVILEVPTADGMDTLAAYADGSARYMNYSGKLLVWEAYSPDAGGEALWRSLLKTTAAHWSELRAIRGHDVPKSGKARLTALTLSGNLAVDSIPKDVMTSGTELLSFLTKRAMEQEQRAR
jgi:hypothetical protein